MTETTAGPIRGRRRRRGFLLLIFGILVLLIARAGLDLWMGHRIDVEIARLEKQYGSLDESTLGVSPVPAADNRARVVRAAAALTAFAPGKNLTDLLTAFNRFVRAPASAPVPADLRAFVEANRAALRLADEARTRRRSNWDVDYATGSDRPPWMEVRTLSAAVILAACLDLEAGRPDDAAKTIATGLAISAAIRQEPDLMAQLWRTAIGLQQFEAVERLVVQSEPSKASLEELARWLAENRAPDLAQVGLLGELKQFNAALARTEDGNFRSGSSVMRDLLPRRIGRFIGPYDAPFWLGPVARLGRPFIRMVRLRYLQQVGHLLEIQAGSRPRPAFVPSADPARWAWIRRLDDMSGAGLDRVIDTVDLFNGTLAATELAVALRRFRLDHGNYPDELTALVPVYVADLPIDPFTGRPPVYAREGAGFRLRAENGENVSGAMTSTVDWAVPK